MLNLKQLGAIANKLFEGFYELESSIVYSDSWNNLVKARHTELKSFLDNLGKFEKIGPQNNNRKLRFAGGAHQMSYELSHTEGSEISPPDSPSSSQKKIDAQTLENLNAELDNIISQWKQTLILFPTLDYKKFPRMFESAFLYNEYKKKENDLLNIENKNLTEKLTLKQAEVDNLSEAQTEKSRAEGKMQRMLEEIEKLTLENRTFHKQRGQQQTILEMLKKINTQKPSSELKEIIELTAGLLNSCNNNAIPQPKPMVFSSSIAPKSLKDSKKVVKKENSKVAGKVESKEEHKHDNAKKDETEEKTKPNL